MNLNSTPASSTASSSSSVDTDEEIDQRVPIFLGVVEKLQLYFMKAPPHRQQDNRGPET